MDKKIISEGVMIKRYFLAMVLGAGITLAGITGGEMEIVPFVLMCLSFLIVAITFLFIKYEDRKL